MAPNKSSNIEDGTLEIPLLTKRNNNKNNKDTSTTNGDDEDSNDNKAKGKSENIKAGFLFPDWLIHPKDANMHPVGHPDYDPRTLHIPEDTWKPLTETKKAYWNCKRTHFDCIVLFQEGAFYHTHGDDAILINQLGLAWSTGKHIKFSDGTTVPTAGIPGKAMEEWVKKFTSMGHKVVIMDQTNSTKAKAGQPVGRDVKRVFTPGTLGDIWSSDNSNYLVSVKEGRDANGETILGVCAVDINNASVMMGITPPGPARIALETILISLNPGELLLEKSVISLELLAVAKRQLGPKRVVQLISHTQFWDMYTTLDNVAREGYFLDPSTNKQKLPEVVETFKENECVMSAFGAIVWYLKECKLDQDILPVRDFSRYDPMHSTASMILDGHTLLNLEILQNTTNLTEKGTLFHVLCHCDSPFGKRLFRRWICNPLRQADAINGRLDAVEELDDSYIVSDMKDYLAQLPDLERKLAQVSQAISKAVSGSVMPKNQQKKFQENLTSTINGFRKLKEMFGVFSTIDPKSKLLCDMSRRMPNLDDLFQSLEILLSLEANEAGNIIPPEGRDEEFDQVRQAATDSRDSVEAFLEKQKKRLGVNRVSLVDLESAQFEVPKKQLSGAKPKEYGEAKSTATLYRFTTPEFTKLCRASFKAEQQLAEAADGYLIKCLTDLDFQSVFTGLSAAISWAAQLDCLLSLVQAKRNLSSTVSLSRPTVVEGGHAMIHTEGLCHPYINPSSLADTSGIVPNDFSLGATSDSTRAMLLTGPNMGGKSTLMRAACICIIMAQVGAYVPATKCTISPCDRIFARMGASDNLVSGESTFMVELNETNLIMQHATPYSLAILDEFGRGTSTHDGCALAYAVLDHLLHMKCLTLFSTHHLRLVQEFQHTKQVRMACMESREVDGRIVFTYKLMDGAAPYSYGIKVAERAGVSQSILNEAATTASHLEAYLLDKAKQKTRRMANIVSHLLSVLESETGSNVPLLALQRQCQSLLASK
eukprot:Phypoly_transcript_01310.p1 GENE.Phypoly_transcript_01310~~Phypoly_transcript_01310.p1  ORF type:complete len:1159 (+),score=151.61 Phypoly_transcript_01310:505-3477(+)